MGCIEYIFFLISAGNKIIIKHIIVYFSALANRNYFKKYMLLLHDTAKNIIGIFHEKCSVKLQ